MDYLKLARFLGLDKDIKPTDELIESAKFLGINANEIILKARFVLMIFLFFTIFIYIISNNVFLIPFFILVSLLVYYYFTEMPKIKASNERLKSLNYAPEIMTVLGTSIELGHNLEGAVKLAADYCGGRISEELARMYKESLVSGKPLLNSLNDLIKEWGKYSNGFERSMRLFMIALKEYNPSKTIKLAMDSFLRGLSIDLRKFLASIKTHTLILFSFGTIMPLIFISMMPVFNLLNINSSLIVIILLLGINLLLLWVYSNYIISKKPSSFSQLIINKGKNNISLPILLFFVISSPSLIHYFFPLFGAYFPLPKEYASFPLIIALPLSLSMFYYINSYQLLKKHKKSLKAEKELLGIVYSLGINLQEKRSFEDAIKKIIKNKGIITHYLKKAFVSIKQLKINTEKAVMKEISLINSNRVNSVFSLVFQAVRQGVEKSADSVFKIYEHFNRMIQVEEESKAILEQVLSMMKITVVVFAPLISAFIVIMQFIINNNVSNIHTSFINLKGFIDIDIMELILGYYISGLVIILTTYNIKLKNGSDKVRLYSELSINMIISLVVYIGTLLLAKVF